MGWSTFAELRAGHSTEVFRLAATRDATGLLCMHEATWSAEELMALAGASICLAEIPEDERQAVLTGGQGWISWLWEAVL